MKISLITDEISADPETAIEIGVEWGVRDFELRGFFADRVPCFSNYQKHHLHDVLDEHQAHIVAISPGVFKIPYAPGHPQRLPLTWMEQSTYDVWTETRHLLHHHLNELLPASLDFANEFGSPLVIIFGFDRAGAPAGKPPEEVLDCLRQATERAHAAGIQLVLENEDGFWADTGARTAQLVSAVNDRGLAVNWDPGNAFFAGDNPYPNGYREVGRLVHHVHFKDARRDQDGSLHHVVNGQIDWAGQILALSKDRFEGFVSVETHVQPKVSAGLMALKRLRAMMEAAGVPTTNA
jgi:sugar phosphate isomerase/epimerase